MSLSEIILSENDDPVPVFLNDNIKNQIISNAEYIKMDNMLSLFKEIIGETHDVVSWFIHENGEKYGLINTIFGNNYKTIFENKIQTGSWNASICSPCNKRRCVKEYLNYNNCNKEYVYCIMLIEH